MLLIFRMLCWFFGFKAFNGQIWSNMSRRCQSVNRYRFADGSWWSNNTTKVFQTYCEIHWNTVNIIFTFLEYSGVFIEVTVECSSDEDGADFIPPPKKRPNHSTGFEWLWQPLNSLVFFIFFVFRSNDIKRLMLWRCTFFQRFQNHQKKNVEDPKSFCHNLSKQLISWCVLAICRNKLTFAPDIYRNQQNIIENHF